MGKNRSASGITNVIQYDNNGNITFVSGSTTLMKVSSSGAITTTGVISGSNALSASFSLNSALLNGTGSVGFATTSSLLTVSSSQQQISASQQQLSSSFLTLTASFNAVSSSQQQISASLLQVSASYIALSGSYNTFSGSASTRITDNSSSIQQVSSSQQQISSSQQQISSSLLNVISVFATTGSNSFRATQSITGSLTVTGQIIAQTLNVQQVTSSIIYSSGSNNFGCDLNSRQTFTGSLNVTGSNHTIFGNVGIGTSSPNSYSGYTTLTINNTTTGAVLDLNRSGTRTGTFYADTSGVGIGSLIATNLDIFTGNSYIAFQTCGLERMRITSAGCVGIGTCTPVGKLDVTLVNTRRFIVTYDDSIITIKGASDTGAGENLRIIGDNLIFNTNSVGSGTERMRITSTGIACFACQVCAPYICVGRNAAGDTTNYGLSINRHGDLNCSHAYTTVPAFTIGEFSNAGPALGVVDTNGIWNLSFGRYSHTMACSKFASLMFIGYDGAMGPLRVDGRGNMFIGYDRTAANGSDAVFSLLVACGITAGSYQYCVPPGGGALFSGNVGIGATSPAARLHTCTAFNGNNIQAIFGNSNYSINSIVYDTVIIQADDVTTLKLIERNSGGVDQVLTMTTGDNSTRISTTCANSLQFFVAGNPSACGYNGLSGTAALTITCAGNVGIGTAAPSYRLETQKTGAQAPGIFVNQCSSDEATIRFKSTHSCMSDFRIGASILVGSAFEIYNVQCNRTNYMVNCLGYSKMSPDGTFVNGNNTLYHSIDSINDVVLYAYNRSATGNGIISNVQACNTSYYSYRGFSDPYGDMAFIYSNGTFGSRTGTYGGIVSDARCKTEICDASSQWSDIKNLRVRNFKLIEDVENDPTNALRQIGFIAQEVETVSPGLVFESGNGCVDSGCWKNVKTSIIHTKAVKALQEAMCRIEILESCLGIS